jgi:hypothetical protein
VSVGRLRSGELFTGAGAVLLLVSLFLDWTGPAGESGWSSLGWPTLLLALAAIVATAWLIAATAVVRPVTQVMAAAVIAAIAGPIAFVVLVVRTAIAQPGSDAVTSIEGGAYVGLLGALALAVGAWWSMADERTDAPESAYTPPAARPAPPAESA